MKKNIIYVCIAGLLVMGTGLNSCSNFEDYNTNPDVSTRVTSGMLATNLILNIMKETGDTKGFMRDKMLCKDISWTEENDIDYMFNKLGRFDESGMYILNNVDRMVGFATSEKLKNSYEGLGHFIRVYKFYRMTMNVGDIPYSEALQGDNGIVEPVFDSQKSVFLGLLNELDEADRLFANGDNFDGDPVYKGDVTKWRKAVNVFQLRLLTDLYKKAGDTDLKIKERFQAVVSRPIFTSNADNLQLVHADRSKEKYPFYKEGNSYLVYVQSTSIVIDTLKAYGDRRMFYYAKPSPKSVTDGISSSDWNAYFGVEATGTFAEIQASVEGKNISQINSRYTEEATGEPTYKLSYAEMNFILAEAVARGFLTGNAKSYYEEGIRAAMTFTASNTLDNPDYHHNMKITDDYITTYLQGSRVSFAATADQQIKQIITQKYLAHFLQAPFMSYYEYRRTGYPVIPINPASNRNIPADKMPVRWMYSQTEYDYNTTNVVSAVASQFGGSDTENEIMWILRD